VPPEEYFLTIADNLSRVDPGGRNTSLNQAAYAIARWAKESHLDLSWWQDKLISEAEQNGEAFEDRSEVIGTIQSGFEAGQKAPHVLGQVEEVSIYYPDSFWASRKWLTHIHKAALSAGRSPEALLVSTLTRYDCQVDFRFTLPGAVEGVIGKSHASLNLMGLLVGHAGQGKGDVIDHARTLLPLEVREIPLGSGEGMVEKFFRYEKGDDGKMHWAREHSACLVEVDEGHLLFQLSKRDGQTTDSTLRSAYSGETLGGSYRSNPCILERGTYRFSLILAIQPEKADYLLSPDAKALGTTSRFLAAPLWSQGQPNPLEVKRPPWPGPLRVKVPVVERGIIVSDPWTSELRVDLTYADQVKRQVLLEDWQRNQRNGADPVTAHSTLTTLKVAALISFLEERPHHIEWDDYKLASEMVATSTRTIRYMESTTVKEERKATEGKARMSAHFEVTKSEALTMERQQKCRGCIIRVISAEVGRGKTEVSKGVLNRGIPPEYRDVQSSVITQMVAAQELVPRVSTYHGQPATYYAPGARWRER
jgi:hypothetical protein